jgi:hypothetical protein
VAAEGFYRRSLLILSTRLCCLDSSKKTKWHMPSTARTEWNATDVFPLFTCDYNRKLLIQQVRLLTGESLGHE